MIEKVPAGVVLACCAVMLLRLALGPARRQRFDAFFVRLWRWPRSRRKARKLADDAIARARGVRREGNVYTPDSFENKPPRDRMH
ncbi:hypothetical protein [Piscinibacter sp.]|uniref:hypothetical protein n=1 Tax=Piscinibacter sp. TaxID=1903157 RepID=UPI0039E4EBA1